MNKTLISFILVMAVNISVAQEYPKPYENSTSSAPSAITHFNFDITDSLYMNTGADHRLIFRDYTQTSWSNVALDLSYEACTTQTFAGFIDYRPPSNTLEWYFRSEIDTAVVSQSPKNGADQFPVPSHLLADLGTDDTGDQTGGGSNLDIAHLYGSYSDNKLYFRLDNNGGGFPTSGGLFTYYLYMVGILDPNMSDSTVYLLLYANAVIYTSGLYAMDLADSSLTRIGSISTNISSNSLYLSCNIADLTAQPGWSDWPPPSGFIGAAPVTAMLALTTLTYCDEGKAAIFMPSSNLLDFSAVNTAPQIGGVDVVGDDIGRIAARVTYIDDDNHLPVIRTLHFDDTAYDMKACAKDYTGGAIFETALNVSETGWYKYYFEFSDGVATVMTALDSLYLDLDDFVCGDVNGDDAINLIDVLYLIDHIYGNPAGPAPISPQSGDVNADGAINLIDVLYLIDFIYGIPPGPEPDCP